MGVAIQKDTPTPTSRRYVLSHALMFIGGFTLVFVFLGVITGLLASFGSQIESILVSVGGALLLVLGIHMSGVVKWLIGVLGDDSAIGNFLAVIDRKLDELILPERRKQTGYDQSPGFIRSGVIGMTFAAGWTPCIGPLLGAILTLSLNASGTANPTGAALQSATLLFAYSMGLAVPFILVAWLLNRATGFLDRMKRHVHIIERISAILIIAIGLLLLFGTLSELNYYFSATQPEWVYDLELSLNSYGVSMPVAFVAGLLSFLSPCVLPLIPVYIGYLTGITAANYQQA